jgi:hypothetical protein
LAKKKIFFLGVVMAVSSCGASALPCFGVVGARSFGSQSAVVALVRRLVRTYGADGFVLVSGGCRGVDTWAVATARDLGVRVRVVRPVITAGAPFAVVRRALLARNIQLVSGCDGVFVFLGPRGFVGGSGFVVSACQRLGVPVRVLGFSFGVSGWGNRLGRHK